MPNSFNNKKEEKMISIPQNELLKLMDEEKVKLAGKKEKVDSGKDKNAFELVEREAQNYQQLQEKKETDAKQKEQEAIAQKSKTKKEIAEKHFADYQKRCEEDAEKIIQELSFLSTEAAKNGYQCMVVMQLLGEYYRFMQPGIAYPIEHDELLNNCDLTNKLVYEYCKKSGFQVAVMHNGKYYKPEGYGWSSYGERVFTQIPYGDYLIIGWGLKESEEYQGFGVPILIDEKKIKMIPRPKNYGDCVLYKTKDKNGMYKKEMGFVSEKSGQSGLKIDNDIEEVNIYDYSGKFIGNYCLDELERIS